MRQLVLACLLAAVANTGLAAEFYPGIASAIATAESQFEQIEPERRKQLRKIALYVRTQVSTHGIVNLTFICTHNSRRSHMSQLWAKTAAQYYGVEGVNTFSGGTEATAFNPRAVAALRRVGFRISIREPGDNPVYEVHNGPELPVMTAFSKKYQHEENPQENFCAVMTCSEADKNCPTVDGAAYRVAIPYEDPKAFDGTDREAAAYDERSRQISREMFFLFSQV